MKTKILLGLFVLGLVFASCKQDGLETVADDSNVSFTEQSVDGNFIVVFDNNQTNFKAPADASYVTKKQEVEEFSSTIMKEVGVKKSANLVYGAALKGISVQLTNDEVEKLKSNPNVKGVYPDKMVTLAKPGSDVTDPPAEVLPFGIARVGYANYTGSGKAWIIDTGIDYDHPDLNVNTSLAYLASTIRSKNGADDDNGHGTHCAGTVAAIDNEIGVIGVAAGAEVVPVKVLDRRGSGAYSGILEGVDYVASTANPGDSANLSLGGGAYTPIDEAVQALGEAGVFVAMAAGNESDDANNHSPARANGPNLYTVSAMDSSDVFAYFSNYGNPPVDYCAPGVSVYSTYKGGAYATMSGTSMASPHVCGLLLLTGGNLKTDGYVIGDPDGNPDPIAHK